MTPPLTRPTGPIRWFVAGGAVFALVLPLARRDDWLGGLAFAVICGFSILIWSSLFYRLWVAIFRSHTD